MKQKPTKAMIDIETMDTLPSSAIVSIGCVLFDESGVSDHRFYRNIDLYSSMAAGGTTGAETIQWWMNQSSQAKQQLLESPVPELQGLKSLTEFLRKNLDERGEIWANGISFDPVILESGYRRHGMNAPWMHWQLRDFRTEIKRLDPTDSLKQKPTAHNALADAVEQAERLVKAWNW